MAERSRKARNREQVGAGMGARCKSSPREASCKAGREIQNSMKARGMKWCPRTGARWKFSPQGASCRSQITWSSRKSGIEVQKGMKTSARSQKALISLDKNEGNKDFIALIFGAIKSLLPSFWPQRVIKWKNISLIHWEKWEIKSKLKIITIYCQEIKKHFIAPSCCTLSFT